jgi:hypothetical protein
MLPICPGRKFGCLQDLQCHESEQDDAEARKEQEKQ